MNKLDWFVRKPFKQGNSFTITVPRKYKNKEVVVVVFDKSDFAADKLETVFGERLNGGR